MTNLFNLTLATIGTAWLIYQYPLYNIAAKSRETTATSSPVQRALLDKDASPLASSSLHGLRRGDTASTSNDTVAHSSNEQLDKAKRAKLDAKEVRDKLEAHMLKIESQNVELERKADELLVVARLSQHVGLSGTKAKSAPTSYSELSSTDLEQEPNKSEQKQLHTPNNARGLKESQGRHNKSMLLPSTVEEGHPNKINHHIVVAYCVDDLSWLNQLHNFDPSICTHTHVHIYSKCGTDTDLQSILPRIVTCTTLHRIHNCGIEEYAYLSYIQDWYDRLPSRVSFVQGGAITENPHIIHDMLDQPIPGMYFKDLSRQVRDAWHFGDYDKDEKARAGEYGIVMSAIRYLEKESLWLNSWRGMFTTTRNQIRLHPLEVYAGINEKLCGHVCSSRNCNMETFWSSLMGCSKILFREGSSISNGGGDEGRVHQKKTEACTGGRLKNLSPTVFDEDYKKDSLKDMPKDALTPSNNTDWIQCGSKTILYTTSFVNGVLMCIDKGSDQPRNSTTSITELYREMIRGDKRDVGYLSNLTFQRQHSSWVYNAAA